MTSEVATVLRGDKIACLDLGCVEQEILLCNLPIAHIVDASQKVIGFISFENVCIFVASCAAAYFKPVHFGDFDRPVLECASMPVISFATVDLYLQYFHIKSSGVYVTKSFELNIFLNRYFCTENSLQN